VDKSYWDQIKPATYAKLAALSKSADPTTISQGQYVMLMEAIVREVRAFRLQIGVGLRLCSGVGGGGWGVGRFVSSVGLLVGWFWGRWFDRVDRPNQ
jgi:hypothetical protein